MDIRDKFLAHVAEFESASAVRGPSDVTGGSPSYRACFTADARFRHASKQLGFDYPQSLPKGDQAGQIAEIKKRFHLAKDFALKLQLVAVEEIAALEYADPTNDLSPAFTPSPEGKALLDELIGQMRKEVRAAEWVEGTRKQNILNAINALQTEIDKEISNFHKFLGMITDVGDALGEFGEKAKPFGDLVAKVAKAVKGERRKTQQIGNDPKPKQITDQSGDGADVDDA